MKDGFLSFIILGMVLAAGIIFIYFIITDISYTIDDTLSHNTNVSDIFGESPSFIVFLPLLCAVIAIAFLYLSWDDELEEDVEDVKKDFTPKQERRSRKSAIKIIRERYANGEITGEEYTEMMSRL